MTSYTVPFSIPFRAQMSSGQTSWLREELALTFHSKPVLDPQFPYAFGLLDRASGLFLVRGVGDRWTLECRAYGEPTPEQVEAWKARAAWVVQALPPH